MLRGGASTPRSVVVGVVIVVVGVVEMESWMGRVMVVVGSVRVVREGTVVAVRVPQIVAATAAVAVGREWVARGCVP